MSELDGSMDRVMDRKFEIVRRDNFYALYSDGELRLGALTEYDLRQLISLLYDELLKCSAEQAELYRRAMSKWEQ